MTATTWLLALILTAPVAAQKPAPPQREQAEEAAPADEPALAPDARQREEEAEDQAQEARVKAKAKEFAKNPPAEATLGVPLYPGARYDAELSAGMSLSGDDARYDIYLSADPVEKVTAFYEQKTGKKAERTPGGALIAVKGSGLFPALGLTVQPNGIAEGWRKGMKSMVTVRRSAEGR